MALVTAAEAETTWLDVIEWVHDQVLGIAANFTTDAQSILTNKTGDDMRRVIPHVDRARRIVISALRPALEAYRDAFRDYCLAVSPQIDFDRVGMIEATRLFRHYLDDVEDYAGGSVDKDVTSRNWTRGAEASPTSTQIFRLLTDEYSQAIEDGYAQTNTIKVISSVGDDPRVEVRGEPQGADLWQQEIIQQGMPDPIIIPLVSDLADGGSRATNHVLRGVTPTTDAAAVTAAPTGWTMTTVGNWVVESTAASQYRTLTQCLRTGTATSNHDIYQAITRSVDPRVPYLPAFLADNDNSWVGTLTLTWGGASQAFTNSAVTSGWKWHAADRDQDLWPLNWDSDGAQLKLEQTARSGGDCKIGAIGLFPGRKRIGDGGWWWGFSQDTDPLYAALATIADTIGGSEGKIQQIHHLACWVLAGRGSYLNTTGTNLIAEP